MLKRGGQQLKPIERSKLRLFLGKNYYTLKKHLQWSFSKETYAKRQEEKKLDHLYFSHRTPLYRKLKNVDMWLQENKVRNLNIAIKTLDGLVLQPGETMSYWKRIGNPTAKKGYVEGMQLSHGSFIANVGGGLCQLSNLIYWMTLHTPLTVTERNRHSYDVFPDVKRKQPFGSGATCVYNYIDLQIKNETDTPMQLCLEVGDTHLKGEWGGEHPPDHTYQVYEKEHWITHEYWGGYLRHNLIHRKVFCLDGTVVDDEYVTENHAIMMYQPLLEQGEVKEGKTLEKAYC